MSITIHDMSASDWLSLALVLVVLKDSTRWSLKCQTNQIEHGTTGFHYFGSLFPSILFVYLSISIYIYRVGMWCDVQWVCHIVLYFFFAQCRIFSRNVIESVRFLRAKCSMLFTCICWNLRWNDDTKKTRRTIEWTNERMKKKTAAHE